MKPLSPAPWLLFVSLVFPLQPASAQWKPERTIELISSTAAGGNQDATARVMQRIWQEKKLVSQSVVMNRPGGGGNIAAAFLTQHPRDAHYVLLLAPTMFTNRITGSGTVHYTDFTPLGLLYNENVFISVKADSPVKSGRDLVERLRKDPAALSVAIASVLGNHIHMGIAIPAKIAGVDVKKMKVVPFKSSGDSLTALAGGHIDVAASTFGTILPHLQAGRVRVIAVSAAQRLPGTLTSVPTWKEQGVDTAFASWRGVIGARGLSDAQVAYWDQVLAASTATEEWRKEVERNHWSVNYLSSREVRKYWDQQYRELEDVLTELGLVKKSG